MKKARKLTTNKEDAGKGYFIETEVVLLLGAFLTGLPVMIIGLVAAWRERQIEKMPQ